MFVVYFQEFVLPLYMVAILAIIRATSVQDAKPPIPMFPEYYMSDPVWNNPLYTNYSGGRLLVTPDNDFTRSIMTDVVSLAPSTLLPEYFTNETEAETAHSTNRTSVFAGVTFNYNSTSSLSYAIRMDDGSNPSTDDDIYKNQRGCRDDNTGVTCDVTRYLHSGFAVLQSLVDTALIRNKTGNTAFPEANSSVQMLPKPAFLQDTSYLQTLSSIYFVIAFTPLINVMTVLIVTEKEKKIKEGMKMMGLRSSVFW